MLFLLWLFCLVLFCFVFCFFLVRIVVIEMERTKDVFSTWAANAMNARCVRSRNLERIVKRKVGNYGENFGRWNTYWSMF